MEGGQQSGLLDALSEQIEKSWEDVADDRKLFFRGLNHLQAGEIDEAARVFRRAARRCEPPYSVMARMAQGRCEVVRGHQGAALRVFREVADSQAPPELRRLAWMEVVDLANERQDKELLEKARRALTQYGAARP